VTPAKGQARRAGSSARQQRRRGGCSTTCPRCWRRRGRAARSGSSRERRTRTRRARWGSRRPTNADGAGATGARSGGALRGCSRVTVTRTAIRTRGGEAARPEGARVAAGPAARDRPFPATAWRRWASRGARFTLPPAAGYAMQGSHGGATAEAAGPVTPRTRPARARAWSAVADAAPALAARPSTAAVTGRVLGIPPGQDARPERGDETPAAGRSAGRAR
jgi:hypothetical protein